MLAQINDDFKSYKNRIESQISEPLAEIILERDNYRIFFLSPMIEQNRLKSEFIKN